MDGVNHVPRTVDGFDIHAGQRYSVILNANKDMKNYWIRAPMELQHDRDNKNCAYFRHLLTIIIFGPYVACIRKWIPRMYTLFCTMKGHPQPNRLPKPKVASTTQGTWASPSRESWSTWWKQFCYSDHRSVIHSLYSQQLTSGGLLFLSGNCYPSWRT